MRRTTTKAVWRGALQVVLTLAACWFGSAPARAEPVADYRMKAAIVYNLALFTTWPDDADNGEFHACFLQAGAIHQGMLELGVRAVSGRALVLRKLNQAETPRGCHLLVVGALSREKWQATRRATAGLPVLVISDELGLQDGVMIAMTVEDKHVMLDIDQSAARAARLVPSSKLLRLARTLK